MQGCLPNKYTVGQSSSIVIVLNACQTLLNSLNSAAPRRALSSTPWKSAIPSFLPTSTSSLATRTSWSSAPERTHQLPPLLRSWTSPLLVDILRNSFLKIRRGSINFENNLYFSFWWNEVWLFLMDYYWRATWPQMGLSGLFSCLGFQKDNVLDFYFNWLIYKYRQAVNPCIHCCILCERLRRDCP